MVKWELYEGKVPSFDMPRFDNQSVRFLTKNEASKLLEEIKRRSTLWYDLSLLALNTGCRAGELFRLRGDLVDFNNKVIYVMDSKNGKSRAVPINKISINVLERYRLSCSELIFTNSEEKKLKKFPLCSEIVYEH